MAVTLMVACKDDLLVFTHPGYAIGAVDYFSPGQLGHSSSIRFSYTVSGNEYRAYYYDDDHRWEVPSSGHIKNHSLYMVQYDSLNPSTARMLFDYPLKDSSEYQKYADQFRNSPPGY